MISTTAPMRMALGLAGPISRADNSSSAGRRRLPPLDCRYLPMVVTASADATDSRLICCSTRWRSSEMRSKISLAVRACPSLPKFMKLTSLPVCGPGPQTEPLKIGGGEAGDLLRRRAAHFGEHADGIHQEGRFVAFAAPRNGGQVGCVGLDQQAVAGSEGRGVAHCLRFGERQHAPERQVKSAVQSLAGFAGSAGEAVHDAFARPMPVQQAQGIVPRLAGMDDDGLRGLAREFELALKDLALHGARSEVVVVVQADLADGDYLGVAEQPAEILVGFGRRLGGVVGMHAHGGVNERILIGQPDGYAQVRRPVAGADGQHALDPRRARPGDDRFAILREARVIQMAVRVDQRHFSRAPTGTSSRKPANTGEPPSSEAATIMPSDWMPRSLRGFKFATMTTLRPRMRSGE